MLSNTRHCDKRADRFPSLRFEKNQKKRPKPFSIQQMLLLGSGESQAKVFCEFTPDFYQPILSEPIFRSVCLVGPRTFCPIQHIREVDGS